MRTSLTKSGLCRQRGAGQRGAAAKRGRRTLTGDEWRPSSATRWGRNPFTISVSKIANWGRNSPASGAKTHPPSHLASRYRRAPSSPASTTSRPHPWPTPAAGHGARADRSRGRRPWPSGPGPKNAEDTDRWHRSGTPILRMPRAADRPDVRASDRENLANANATEQRSLFVVKRSFEWSWRLVSARWGSCAG